MSISWNILSLLRNIEWCGGCAAGMACCAAATSSLNDVAWCGRCVAGGRCAAATAFVAGWVLNVISLIRCLHVIWSWKKLEENSHDYISLVDLTCQKQSQVNGWLWSLSLIRNKINNWFCRKSNPWSSRHWGGSLQGLWSIEQLIVPCSPLARANPIPYADTILVTDPIVGVDLSINAGLGSCISSWTDSKTTSQLVAQATTSFL